MPARRRRMRQPARSERGRRLQHRRSRLLVQRCGAASETAESAAKAKAADDHGLAPCCLQGGAGGAGCEAIASYRRAFLAATKCANMRYRSAVSARHDTDDGPKFL